MKLLLGSYSDNIPNLFLFLSIAFFFYISYLLSEGEISITLTSEGILTIKTKEKPIIGDFENTYLRLSDIESYAFTWSRMSKFLTIYLHNREKIIIEIGGLGIKPDKDKFFKTFPIIISCYNENNNTNIYERRNFLQKLFSIRKVQSTHEI